MAWGYAKSFTLEHDPTVKRRISCRDCIYYEKDDKSCMKRPLYLPEDGYNSWRRCAYFELDEDVSHYQEKQAQYDRVRGNSYFNVGYTREENSIIDSMRREEKEAKIRKYIKPVQDEKNREYDKEEKENISKENKKELQSRLDNSKIT